MSGLSKRFVSFEWGESSCDSDLLKALLSGNDCHSVASQIAERWKRDLRCGDFHVASLYFSAHVGGCVVGVPLVISQGVDHDIWTIYDIKGKYI